MDKFDRKIDKIDKSTFKNLKWLSILVVIFYTTLISSYYILNYSNSIFFTTFIISVFIILGILIILSNISYNKKWKLINKKWNSVKSK